MSVYLKLFWIIFLSNLFSKRRFSKTDKNSCDRFGNISTSLKKGENYTYFDCYNEAILRSNN